MKKISPNNISKPLILAGVSFLFGVFFLSSGSITGNVVLTQGDTIRNYLSFIGVTLIFCSTLLAISVLRKK
ncbi:MAG: hypothetical protein WDZ77_00955 [Candidatus Pacearchaeota archaeon]